MNDFRIERDTMGDIPVLTSALYGAQTQRAVNNFLFSDFLLTKSIFSRYIIRSNHMQDKI